MTSSPDNTMEILEHYFTGEHYDEMNGTFIRIPFKKQMEKAKQSLDSHYLSIFLETIEKIDKNANPTQQWEVNDLNVRSRLKFELRTALQDRLGEKS